MCSILRQRSEEPLVEMRHTAIMKAAFRAVPEHVLLVPKEHVKGIHEMRTPDAREMLSAIHAILERRRHLIAFGHYGIPAGQTVPHLHVHVMAGNTGGITTVRETGGNARFNDPLSEIILYNAGYGVCRQKPWFEAFYKDFGSEQGKDRLWGSIQLLWNEFSATFSVMRSGSFVLPARYSAHENAKRRQVGGLMKNRTGAGLGMIWCISRENDNAPGGRDKDAYVLRAAAKATVIDPADLSRTTAAPEIFFNTTYRKTGLPHDELERWNGITAGFHSEIKWIFNQ